MTSIRRARGRPVRLLVVAFLVMLTVLLGLAACGASRDAVVSSQDATVNGKVLNGGPHPVSVIAARMRPDKRFQVFRTVTSNAGAFSLSVPPGAYILTSLPAAGFWFVCERAPGLSTTSTA
jgi:hypothetical protein